jgi:hypothetical protein
MAGYLALMRMYARLFTLFAAVAIVACWATSANAAAWTITGKARVQATGPLGAKIRYTAPAYALCTPASGVQVRVGKSVRVSCRAGRTVRARTFSVIDTLPPRLNLAAQQIEATALLTPWHPAAAHDVVDGAVPVSCASARFALGAHQVTCTARDRHGNRSSRSVQVRLVDTTAPKIEGLEDVDLEADETIEDQLQIEANDSVDALPQLACNLSLDSTLSAGEHDLACTASDASGNTSAATAHVTVHSPVDPDLVNPAPEPPAPDPTPDPTPVDPGLPGAMDNNEGNVLELHTPATLGQPFYLPAPNAANGWRLVGSTAQVITDGNEYSAAGSGWTLQGEGTSGRVKENILVTSRQGVRTWTWQLMVGDGAQPVLRADGTVAFGHGVVIAAPLVTNTQGQALAITQPRWQLSGTQLSLQLDDTNLPLPYVIDPATVYPTVTITSGPADGSLHGSSPKLFTFTYTQGPATSVSCWLTFQSVFWSDALQTYQGLGPTTQQINGCNTSFLQGMTPALVQDGLYTFSVHVVTPSGEAITSRSFTVDSTPPTPFGLQYSQYQSMPAIAGLPACAVGRRYVRETDNAGFYFSPLPRDDHSGLDHYEITDDGVTSTLPATATGYVSIPGPKAAGQHTMIISAFNRRGLATTLSHSWWSDTQPPTMPTIYSPASMPASAVALRFGSTDDVCVRSYSVRILRSTLPASVAPQPDAISSSGAYWQLPGSQGTLNITGLQPGPYQWQVSVLDGAAQGATTPWMTFTVT